MSEKDHVVHRTVETSIRWLWLWTCEWAICSHQLIIFLVCSMLGMGFNLSQSFSLSTPHLPQTCGLPESTRSVCAEVWQNWVWQLEGFKFTYEKNVRAKTSRKDPQAVGPHVSWVTVGTMSSLWRRNMSVPNHKLGAFSCDHLPGSISPFFWRMHG